MNFFGNGDNCGCSIIWILLLLSCCGNGSAIDSCCGNGNNSCIWIILLLLLCGGCGCQEQNARNCGCGC